MICLLGMLLKLETQYTCFNVATWFEMSARCTWDDDWMPRIETENLDVSDENARI